MASFHIHIAIGKRYAQKNNNIKNLSQFYRGILDPDLTDDKEKTHYTGSTDNSNLEFYLKEKVILPRYLKEHSIDSDYQKGYFLHLITDYLYFTDFFDKEYIRTVPYQTFVEDLYYSYNVTNAYVQKKYDIDLSAYEEELTRNIEENRKKKMADGLTGNNIIPYEKLDAFIKRVSDISLEEYALKLKKAGQNVLPDEGKDKDDL